MPKKKSKEEQPPPFRTDGRDESLPPVEPPPSKTPDEPIGRRTQVLPVLPLPDVVIFPNSISPLFVVRSRSVAAVEQAAEEESEIFLVAQRSTEPETPKPSDLHDIGTISQILQMQRLPDNSLRIFIEGLRVARVRRYFNEERAVTAAVEPVEFFSSENGKNLLALKRTVLKQFDTYAHLSDKIPEDLYLNIRNIEEPLALANAIANYSFFKTSDKQTVLEFEDVAEKMLYLSRVFSVENELLAMEGKILNQVKNQIGKNQKEYFLNEQLKVIEKELGLVNEEDVELETLQRAIDECGMSEEARDKAERELARLSRMAPMSPESTVSRTYIDWLLDYPWDLRTEDNLDLRRAMRVLNEDHYGLEKVKERIVEYLAVMRLVETGTMRGPILCLVGPPGVGKTSLARSIARTLDRRFVRFSLGGVRDEAEIRGHRRTYIGALPGKLVQLLKKADSENPVLLLDEIDKMNSDFRGDPASALLEVLDPEQNSNFNDHYMEVDLDLSHVLFLTTANTMDGIPWALRDRMEVLRLPGYTRDEKLEIAKRFLVPRQLERHGLNEKRIRFTTEGIEYVFDHYTREAGVRNLEREIAALCRKVARKVATARKELDPVEIDAAAVHRFLGAVHYSEMELQQTPEIGMATGLAWTEVGGELLSVEATCMPGKGNLQLTGKLGDVMQESAKAALSYIRAHAGELGVPADFYEKTDLHVHLPEGAIPKDGPSAGVALITALVSKLSGCAVRQDLAMTGEITLRGRVLRIGGLKEKVIAAHRAKIATVVLPAENEDDLNEIAPHIRRDIEFVLVREVSEVLSEALLDAKGERRKPSGGVKRRRPRKPSAKRGVRRPAQRA